MQPQVYKKIIVDVQTSVGVDFEEYGMDGAVLDNLILVGNLSSLAQLAFDPHADLQKWEEKLMQTKAADFQPAQPEHDGGGSSADRHADRSRAGQTENRGSTSETYGYASSTNGSQPYQSPSQYSANRQYAGSLALPSIGYDDVRVKAEPDEVLRPRGGAVCLGLRSCHHAARELISARLTTGDRRRPNRSQSPMRPVCYLAMKLSTLTSTTARAISMTISTGTMMQM